MENRAENKKLKIGIVGLGLIGGSILKCLHKKDKYELYAASKSSFLKAASYCTLADSDTRIVKDCDVVFVASKMRDTLNVLDELENIVSKDCIVTDACSLKRFVYSKERPYKFIGSHPMAGTEFSGFDSSFPELFRGAKWILNEPNEILEKLIKEMGAAPLIMDKNTHDKYAGLISHLPMLISCALVDTVSKSDHRALQIAASGFRDASRLALTNPDLAQDMLFMNFDNLDVFIDEFTENLKAIKSMSREEFSKTLKAIQQQRAEMYDEKGKNRL